MNITQIKSSLNLKELSLNVATNADGTPAVSVNAEGVESKWFRHWDNDNRVAVSIAEDLLLEIKGNKNLDSLGLQKEMRGGAETGIEEYTSYRIVKYTPSDHKL